MKKTKQFNARFADDLIKRGVAPVEVCRTMGIGRDRLKEELSKYEQEQSKRNKRK